MVERSALSELPPSPTALLGPWLWPLREWCAMGRVGSPWQLQAQPLDVLTAEVYAQSQHLAYFNRREAPRQRARVGAPVV